MKKLMTIAAATALAAVAEAGIAVWATNCTYNASNPNCPDVVFKVTGSGKALDPFSKEYTTVSKLKVNGYLVLFPDDSGSGLCCYPTYSLYVSGKIGKNTADLIFAGAGSEAVDAWTVFGKKLLAAETGIDDKGKSKSKKYKLESQLGISADHVGGNAGGTLLRPSDLDQVDQNQPLVTFIATSFGKATWKNSVTYCDKCTKLSDGSEITPGTYSGWFAGMYYWPDIDEACLTCYCTDLGLFGGTWKAKYQSKIDSWQVAATKQFGAAVAKGMKDRDIE